MADLIKIEPEKIDASLGQLAKATNGIPLEALERLASVLKPMAGNEPVVDKVLECCKKFEATYNSAMESVRSLIEEAGHVVDLGTNLNKAYVTEASTRDASFKVEGIDPGAVAR